MADLGEGKQHDGQGKQCCSGCKCICARGLNV